MKFIFVAIKAVKKVGVVSHVLSNISKAVR